MLGKKVSNNAFKKNANVPCNGSNIVKCPYKD